MSTSTLRDGYPPSQTKSAAAYGALRVAIEQGRLEPGRRLPMAELRRELQMSPTPIREALRLLQADGLVQHRPHHGVVVAEYTPERADEIYRLRIALEPLAVRLAVERANEADIAELAELSGELAAAVESGDPCAAALNANWHRRLYAAARSRYLEEFIARLWTVLPVSAVWTSSRGPDSLAEHAQIMRALVARDAEAASAGMLRHLAAGSLMTAERLRHARGSG